MAEDKKDIEKLKRKRSTIRQMFTKLITKVESTINESVSDKYTKNQKLDDLSEQKNQLVEKIKNLKVLDSEVEECIDIKDLDDEIMQSEEYQEKGISWITKLDRNLENLNRNAQSKETETNNYIRSGASEINSDRLKTESNVVKLPKLNINKFYGDCSYWLDFWNSYEVAIHNNASLSKIEKFTYLKTYLGGIALTAVSGFSLTSENYDSSIALLNERFGRSDLIISSHMHKLLLIEPVKTCSNVWALRKMYDAIEVQVRSLNSLKVATGTYSNLLCPVILQKIPEELNLNYNRQRDPSALFDINHLIEFLRKEIECRETSLILSNPRRVNKSETTACNQTITQGTLKKDRFTQKYSSNNSKPHISSASALSALSENETCIFCADKTKTKHTSGKCPLTVVEKKNSLKRDNRCFNCLKRGSHTSKYCRNKEQMCKNCRQPHNYLICEKAQSELNVNISKSSENEGNALTVSSLHCAKGEFDRRQSSVLLQTFSARVKSQQDCLLVRVICDSGASRSFVKREIVEKLGLKCKQKETLQIYAFGGEKGLGQQIYDIVELELINRSNPFNKIKLETVVVDAITHGQIEVPSQWLRSVASEIGIELADIGNSKEVDILIGSDYMWEILHEGNIRLGKRLVAIDSMFGFIIQGMEMESDSRNAHVNVNYVNVLTGDLNQEQIFEQAPHIWELEAIGINHDKEILKSDSDVIDLFKQNTIYKNNRYETKLLWNDNCKLLKSNYRVAERRLVGLNNKFKHNSDLHIRYKEIIEEQLSNDIIERVAFNYDSDKDRGYFMPHHAVVREQKESTKVRIVYDASSKDRGEQSLNDCLDSGPNLNPDLLKIIMKFRNYPVVFCADIQRAFLEVGIAEEDRKYLQFLWGREKGTDLDSSGHEMEVFRMKRVPFGVKCSPFLLSATVRLHIEKYKNSNAEAYNLLSELYVDDLISGASTVENAARVSIEAKNILKDASMNMRRWVTNSSKLTKLWKENDMDCRPSLHEFNVPLKVLGLLWDNEKDTLKIDLDNLLHLKNTVSTKRLILSACGKMFDPIGFLTPFSVRVKLLMQCLWKRGLNWDDTLPIEIESVFHEWIDEIPELQGLIIPRPYFSDMHVEHLEIHIFSDASPKAYGAVAYFKARHQDKISTSFIISKSRLAPLKEISLPRLELLGCLISARLASYLQSTFPSLHKTNIYLWTDSQVCLYWITNPASEWKQWVRNRVNEIKLKTELLNWNYCQGKANPADKLTRGLSAKQLINEDMWWNGPPWLLEDESSNQEQLSPPEIHSQEIEIERKRVIVNLQTCVDAVETILDLNKYSDLDKILRITSYVLRFIYNCKSKSEKRNGVPTTEERKNAEVYWVRFTQRTEFAKEYAQLETGLQIKSDSKLYGLNPVVNTDGLVCLGGRLHHSEFELREKHPLILPNKSRFTELLIKQVHRKLFHSGVSDTLTQLRENYWIIRGRQTVKSCLNKCLVCKRFKAKRGSQETAPLPADRIQEATPFEITAVDFAGPLYARESNKVYIALFTCGVTRAVHLELVSSLSTEHFLLALRRFVSRRGVCRTIYSDNAKTFKAADFELKQLYTNITDPAVQNFFGTRGISWKFIVERAAWWGGFWERMVKIVKSVLRKVLGKALLSFEEQQTILAEVEAIVNSRPLTFVYNEPLEPFPLTPAHFLTGKRLTAVPHQVGQNKVIVKSNKRDLIKRYLYREKILNHFWKRWKREYLLQLKSANCKKPINVVSNFNVNDIVLVGDDKLPRQMWRLGRVTEIHSGRDKKVRSVTLKTSSGLIKRPVQLLYNLEIE